MGRRTNFEYPFCDVFKHAATLHHHHTRSYLVRPIGSSELLHGESTQTVDSHSRHGNVPPPARVTQGIHAQRLGESPRATVQIRTRATAHGPQRGCRHARRGTHGQLRSLVYAATDGCYGAEDPRVYRWGDRFARWRGRQGRTGYRCQCLARGIGRGIVSEARVSTIAHARKRVLLSRGRRHGRHAWLCMERRRVEIEGEKRLEELYRELKPGALFLS